MAASSSSVSRAQAWASAPDPQFDRAMTNSAKLGERLRQSAPREAETLVAAASLCSSALEMGRGIQQSLITADQATRKENAAGDAIEALGEQQAQVGIMVGAAAGDVAEIQSHVAPSIWTRMYSRAEQSMETCKKVCGYVLVVGATTAGGAIGGAIAAGTTAAIAAGAGAGVMAGVVVVATCHYGSRCYSYCMQKCPSR